MQRCKNVTQSTQLLDVT